MPLHHFLFKIETLITGGVILIVLFLTVYLVTRSLKAKSHK